MYNREFKIKIRILILGLILILVGTTITNAHVNTTPKSKLPKKMPHKIEIRLFEGGGRSEMYLSIYIICDKLYFENLRDHELEAEKSVYKITMRDKEKLYKLFVENEFDLIKNGEIIPNMYDFPSLTLTLTINGHTYVKKNAVYQVMSVNSLKRFQIIYHAVHQQFFNSSGKSVSLLNF